jgi:nitrate reductase gamma subunit
MLVSTKGLACRIMGPMTTPASTRQRRPEDTEARAQPPIRWPHPNPFALGMIAIWAVGLLVALALPATIVSPTAKNPPTGDVWLALGCTVLGAAIMIGATSLLWRRVRDGGLFVLGMVPAFVCIAGGAMLAAAKIGAS